jgi:hypothetical protein
VTEPFIHFVVNQAKAVVLPVPAGRQALADQCSGETVYFRRIAFVVSGLHSPTQDLCMQTERIHHG